MTPLYKALKANGTSFYAFPGAAEDISAAYQNSNYKMYFSKFILLNFPKQNVATGNDPVYLDFDNQSTKGFGFETSTAYTIPPTFKDQLVESLRNYIANHEVVMKESRINSNEYYYDNTLISTPTEKIFWKWCRKLNLMSLEPAIDGDEFFGNLPEFTANATTNDYFPEILFKEREIEDYSVLKFYKTTSNTLEIELENTEYPFFQVGDVIEISGVIEPTLLVLVPDLQRMRIVSITQKTTVPTSTVKIVTDFLFTNNTTFTVSGNGFVTLVYHRLVQYIGEVNGINNVQQANRSYTEVYAHVPDQTGATPDILFRITADENYKPKMTFPILPSQYQPEIMGAEIFTNPIVSNPSDYPGSYYGQFDTKDFTYTTSDGDSIRRVGDYFGVSGTRDAVARDSRFVDGVTIDFDTDHYVKMNIAGRPLTNFDQFNAMMINGLPPQDFEFNAILWYYTVEDSMGNKTNNLYGISFVDNPDNNPIQSELDGNGNGLRVGAFRKLAATDVQDGVSYAFSLNLNFNIINENPQDTFNPEAINSLFSFNIFNDSMAKLSQTNDAFMRILASQTRLQSDVSNLRQLLYTQVDFQTINARIDNLDSLLKLYATNQMDSTESIRVNLDTTQRPPRINLTSTDPNYGVIYNFRTSAMYNLSGSVPGFVTVPSGKNFLLNILNDDVNNFTLPNDEVLSLILDRDLSYKQSMDVIVDGSANSTQNKKLQIFVNFRTGNSQNPIETQLMETIDLPVYYNTNTQLLNSSATREKLSFDIDTYSDIRLNVNSTLEVKLAATSSLVYNSISKGDVLVLSDFTIGTASITNFSGQYRVNSVSSTSSYLFLDISNNKSLVNFGTTNVLPYTFNDPTKYILSSSPYFKLNKGVKYRVTRISESNDSQFLDRYLVEKYDLAN